MTQDIHSLTEHLQTIKERLSENRKQGMDTKIADIMMLNALPKIMMAQATNQPKDTDSAKRLLGDIENEMKHLRKEEDFGQALKRIADSEREQIAKSETVKLEAMSQEEVIERTNNLINQARENIREKNFEKVYTLYKEIQGIYRYLPKDLKQRVYRDSMEIYARLRESGIFKAKTRWQIFWARIARRIRL